MKITFALAATILAAPLLAFTNPATDEPKIDSSAAADKTAESQSQEVEAKEETRICRRIRADTSSRRKTKLCLTADEWRKYNNIK